MNVDSRALLIACALAPVFAMNGACTTTNDTHRTAEAKRKSCYDCHSTAYALVKTPIHEGVFPKTCADCHSTTSWIPAAGGHPEAKFPITTGSHSNKGIACSDCHLASLGSDALGQNTDCTHCHLGAHNTPAIDAVHTGIPSYPGVPASPHSCLNAGCHPSG